MLLEPSQYFFASDGGSQCVHYNDLMRPHESDEQE